VKKLSLLLFLSASLFGLMALMPEGHHQQRKFVTAFNEEDRSPANLDEFTIHHPAEGEPSDDGLTQGLHREFREVLGRDPASGVEMAREFVFSRELDPKFRLTILRELKAQQFTCPEVGLLANEIIIHSPSPELFEEALMIKSASMNDEEFESFLTEIAHKKESPEYRAILEDFKSKRRADAT
jgi:hypothetical protein